MRIILVLLLGLTALLGALAGGLEEALIYVKSVDVRAQVFPFDPWFNQEISELNLSHWFDPTDAKKMLLWLLWTSKLRWLLV